VLSRGCLWGSGELGCPSECTTTEDPSWLPGPASAQWQLCSQHSLAVSTRHRRLPRAEHKAGSERLLKHGPHLPCTPPAGRCLLPFSPLSRKGRKASEVACAASKEGMLSQGGAGARQPCPHQQEGVVALQIGPGGAEQWGASIKALPLPGSAKQCSGCLLLGEQGKSVSSSLLGGLVLPQALVPQVLPSAAPLPSLSSCRAPSDPAQRCLATTCAHPRPALLSHSPSLRAATSCVPGSVPTPQPSSSHRLWSSPSPAPSSAPSPSKPWWARPEHRPLEAPWGWGASTVLVPRRARGASAPLADPMLLLPTALVPCPATARSCGTPVGPAKHNMEAQAAPGPPQPHASSPFSLPSLLSMTPPVLFAPAHSQMRDSTILPQGTCLSLGQPPPGRSLKEHFSQSHGDNRPASALCVFLCCNKTILHPTPASPAFLSKLSLDCSLPSPCHGKHHPGQCRVSAPAEPG